MFKPHARYTTVYPVIDASRLPPYGTEVRLRFQGWYENEIFLTVWPVGEPKLKEHEGKLFIYVDAAMGIAAIDERANVQGSGEPPPRSIGAIYDVATWKDVGTIYIDFAKV